MKNKILVGSICLTLLVAVMACCFVGCGSKTQADELEKFMNDIENKSYEMVMSLQMVGGIEMEYTYKKDGNKSYEYSPAIIGEATEVYMETVGEKTYTYTKIGNSWVKTETDEPSEDSAITDGEYFAAENFEYVKDEKIYKLKEGVDVGDSGIKEMTIKLDNGQATVSARVNSNGIIATTVIVFKNIGSTEITLPSVE